MPYQLSAEPSPPNPNPMPSYTITKIGRRKWEIVIQDPVGQGDELFFKITDNNSSTSQVSYQST